MNQFVANLRRLLVVAAAVSLLSGLTSVSSRAQGDAKPADPASSTTEQPAAGKKAKKAKQAKQVKAPKAEKVAKAAKPSKVSAEKPAAAPKPAAPPKPAKVKQPKAPELSLEEQKKADGVYAKGTNWLSFRAGWAKRTGELAGNGSMGYGLGYQHMMSRKFAFAAGAGYDVLGRFGASADEAVPFTGEFQRHFKWKTAVRPYVGVGGGFYLRKNYRTAGEYTTTTTGGPHLSFGFTSALDANHVIGIDARVAKLDARGGIVNPTFGLSKDSETVWTIKGSWALAY